MNPTLYLFAGSNGAGKTTFARAYLRLIDPIPRFLNADEIARGLSPLEPQKLAVKAGKFLLREIQDCLKSKISFGRGRDGPPGRPANGSRMNWSMRRGTRQACASIRISFSRSARRIGPCQQAKSFGYQIEIHYLWLPSPQLAIKRIRQRVKMGGHDIPDADVRRRFARSRTNLIQLYGPLADTWQVWDNQNKPPSLILSSESATLCQLEPLL
jgi:predicted ABC-type ATPase